MKIIDQTPFYNENGEISFMDRTKATLQFGAGWIKEMEAQKSVIAVLEKNLDKKFTLLRNVTPPGMNARIPLILVGPTGVYVMTALTLVGMYSARGDQWGTISSGTLTPIKPNLLTRTDRMARAVQVFLQRQGYSDLTAVEAVLLCADTGTNVDSVRPIIRVVMRDALERFAITISQSRAVLNPESCFDVVNRLLTPPPPPATKLVETASASAASQASEEVNDTYAPAFALRGSDAAPSSMAEPSEPGWLAGMGETPAEPAPEPAAEIPQPAAPDRPRRPAITRNQWILLLIMLAVWVVILIVFGFLIVRDFVL
jgi:hypothetical protein